MDLSVQGLAALFWLASFFTMFPPKWYYFLTSSGRLYFYLVTIGWRKKGSEVACLGAAMESVRTAFFYLV